MPQIIEESEDGLPAGSSIRGVPQVRVSEYIGPSRTTTLDRRSSVDAHVPIPPQSNPVHHDLRPPVKQYAAPVSLPESDAEFSPTGCVVGSQDNSTHIRDPHSETRQTGAQTSPVLRRSETEAGATTSHELHTPPNGRPNAHSPIRSNTSRWSEDSGASLTRRNTTVSMASQLSSHSGFTSSGVPAKDSASAAGHRQRKEFQSSSAWKGVRQHRHTLAIEDLLPPVLISHGHIFLPFGKNGIYWAIDVYRLGNKHPRIMSLNIPKDACEQHGTPPLLAATSKILVAAFRPGRIVEWDLETGSCAMVDTSIPPAMRDWNCLWVSRDFGHHNFQQQTSVCTPLVLVADHSHILRGVLKNEEVLATDQNLMQLPRQVIEGDHSNQGGGGALQGLRVIVHEQHPLGTERASLSSHGDTLVYLQGLHEVHVRGVASGELYHTIKSETESETPYIIWLINDG